MGLQVTVRPTRLPVDLALVKDHCSVDRFNVSDDAILQVYMSMATEVAQTVTNRQLCQATYKLTMNEWPNPRHSVPWGRKYLPLQTGLRDLTLFPCPVVSISSFHYVDPDGVTQTYTTYQLDVTSEPAVIRPNVNTDWPSIQTQLKAIDITFLAGYADIASIPSGIIVGILNLIDLAYNNRGVYGFDAQQEMKLLGQQLLGQYAVVGGF